MAELEVQKMNTMIVRTIGSVLLIGLAIISGLAQSGRQTYTGTVVSYGSGFNTRTSTNTFTLIVNGETPENEVGRLVSILQEDGQDRLQDAVRKNDLGTFAVGGRVGRTLNAVVIDEVDGRRRVRALFERWIRFGEIRGGYRSMDYPFGYIELFVDPRTGRGEGTLIEAAQIRWKRDRNSNQYVVEIENFATYPARLMGVNLRGRG
jgi:hypothetical protein